MEILKEVVARGERRQEEGVRTEGGGERRDRRKGVARPVSRTANIDLQSSESFLISDKLQSSVNDHNKRNQMSK